jgi:hypothetical protein
MRNLVFAVSVMAIVGLISLSAFAQESSSSKVIGVVQNGNRTIVFERSNVDLNLDQLSAFSQVTSSDPALASELAKRPSLVNNESFVGKHSALQKYLEKYPDARADIVANPGNYLTPVNGSSWSHAPAGMNE